MESNSLSSFVRILRESLLIFHKNKRLMASILLFTLLYHSYLVFCSLSTINSSIDVFIINQTQLLATSPGSSQYTYRVADMTSNLHEFVELLWLLILVRSISSICLSATCILASALTYEDGNISFRCVYSRVNESWKRLIITWFYISLFDLGYVFLVLSLIFPFVNFVPFSIFHRTNFVHFMFIPVLAFHMYISVFWKMSLVISVLEEKSGLEAFGKASQILEGYKLQGVLINLLYGTPILVLYMWWYMKIRVNLGITYNIPMLMGLILSNVGCVSKFLVDMAFTVLHHKCKLRHGEEVESHGSLEYTKVVSNEPMIGADIP